MYRIDTPDAVDGRFNDNPAIQSPTTRVPAAWLNDVQENLCAVIEGAGIGLDKGEAGQLLAAIGVLIDRVQPIGAILMLDGPLASASLCEINTEYLRADYPRLVAFYTAQGRLIAGSTAAHFRTPNYEGRFPRSISSDATVDPDGPRVEGSLQGQSFESHTHMNSPTPSDSEGGQGRPVTGNTGFGESLTPWETSATGGDETRPKNFATRLVIRGR
ncbi:hypothetical protein JIP62_06130 [Brevundimonas vitis]|uniref:Tail fiber protein n=1 Tax=Brevundimonas vitisensis TaxID=2800818 RepID=A0ABX7BQ22_9CAUL|nr:hypothetical protein [Brevundimonas vitisensis]QQQ19661.1 hypothetical protein JIP62_06130 [Brevundimonas vitisensis]